MLPLSNGEQLPSRTVTRWKDGSPVKSYGVIPKVVDAQRIKQVLSEIKYFWEEVADKLTNEEIAFIDHIFEHNKSYNNWMGVVFAIHKGDVV